MSQNNPDCGVLLCSFHHLFLLYSLFMLTFFIFSVLSMVGLFLIALGTGGIKPCVAAFGGDQFSEHQVRIVAHLWSNLRMSFIQCLNSNVTYQNQQVFIACPPPEILVLNHKPNNWKKECLILMALDFQVFCSTTG